MDPQAHQARIIADRAATDEKVAAFLKQRGIDTRTSERQRVVEQILDLTTNDYLSLSHDVDSYTLANPDRARDAGIMSALEDLTRREWQMRITPVRDEAARELREGVKVARRALQEKDNETFTRTIAEMRERGQEIGNAFRAAQNAVRQEMRKFLDRAGIGTGDERKHLMEQHSRSMVVPRQISEFIGAPTMLEGEQVRLVMREHQQEQERKAAPKNDPAPG